MHNKIACIAEVQSPRLAEAIRKRLAKKVLVRTGPRGKRPQTTLSAGDIAIWFREVHQQKSVPPWLPLTGLGYAVAISSRDGEYELPPGTSELILANSPTRLAGRIAKQVAKLEKCPEQRIVRIQTTAKNEIEVLFLDGELFSLPLDRKHDWNQVRVARDRRYLIVPGNSGATSTIPWDAIRQPASHLDEERRTQRRLAAVLRNLRSGADLTQAKAAQMSGLTRHTIIRLERGGNYPGLGTLKALAKAYKVSLEELLQQVAAHLPG